MSILDIRLYNQLTPQLEAQIEELGRNSSELHNRPDSPERRASHLDRYCSQQDAFKWICAFTNKQMIGRVTALKRDITYNGQSIRLGGIGGVKTHNNWRKQGVSSRLLQIAMNELHQHNCDIAYLCTNFDFPWLVQFYEKFGFVPLNKTYTYTGASGERYSDDDGMIAPINNPDLIEKILKDPKPFNIGRGNW